MVERMPTMDVDWPDPACLPGSTRKKCDKKTFDGNNPEMGGIDHQCRVAWGILGKPQVPRAAFQSTRPLGQLNFFLAFS